MLRINAVQAMRDINDVEEMIEFKCTDEEPKGCIHHGLFYLVDDTLSMLEVRSSIIEKSSFYAIKKVSSSLRDLMCVSDSNEVTALGGITGVW